MSSSSTRRWLIAAGLAMVGFGATAFAQPQPEAKPDSKSDARPGDAAGRRELRREELSKRLAQAKDRVDKGEDPMAVLRELFPAFGGGRPGGRGGPMGERPLDRGPDAGPDGGPDGQGPGMGGGPDNGPDAGPGGGLLGGPRQRRFGPGGNPEGPGPRGGSGPMTPEQVEKTMDFMKAHMPGMHDRIAALREADPIAFERLINRMGPRVREAADIKERDPKLFDLRAEELKAGFRVLESVRNYRDALKAEKSDKPEASPKVESARKELREALDAQYETRLAVQGHEIDGVSKRLDKLRGDLDKSKEKRAANIDAVLKAITEGKEFRDVPFPPPLAPPPGGPRDGRRGERPDGPPNGPPNGPPGGP